MTSTSVHCFQYFTVTKCNLIIGRHVSRTQGFMTPLSWLESNGLFCSTRESKNIMVLSYGFRFKSKSKQCSLSCRSKNRYVLRPPTQILFELVLRALSKKKFLIFSHEMIYFRIGFVSCNNTVLYMFALIIIIKSPYYTGFLGKTILCN